jgi:hypothetical protein
MPTLDEWKDLVLRFVAGVESAPDVDELQSAVLDGTLTLRPKASTAANRDIVQSIVTTGVGNHVHIGVDEAQLEQIRERLFSKTPGVAPPFPSLLFLGRGADMRQIRAHLSASEDRGLVVIRGWPGVGKTSMMSALGRDRRLMRRFPDGVMWTSLGPSPGLLSVLARWGSVLGTDRLLQAPTLTAATEELAPLLASKKMLLLVDDVWDPSHLVPFLSARGPDCMVVTTTRLPEVAESFTSVRANVYPLQVLDEQYALELFQAIAPEVAEQHPAESLDLVRTLECLPLSIHVAGRLLATESKFGWGISELIEDVKSGKALLIAHPPEDRLEPGMETVAALLRKSTDLLSESFREYYAYLGVFAPKPATFDLAALKSVWELDDPKPVVRELVGRGLLEPLGTGRFQMHALLVAHAHSLLSP